MAEKPSTKKNESPSIVNRFRNIFSSPESEHATTREPHQSQQRPEQQYAANGGSGGVNGTQTQTLTLTQQIQQRMPTLILKLKDMHKEQLTGKSEKEQEEYMKRHIESFRDMLHRNIDEFQAIILSARPSADSVNDPDYEQQKEAYCELLKAATGLMSNMQETLNTVLTQYRLFIEELWEAICANKDPSPIATRFQQKTEAYMKQSWDPVFSKADKMMEEIEKSKKRHGDNQ